MGAIIRACLVADVVKNTGKECDASMGATAMLLALPKTVTFNDTDLLDPTSWLNTAIHAAKASRVYPLFGQQAPIRTITNTAENDVIVTLDDGSQVFLRYGFFNRMFETTSGGICYAEALQGLNKSGYSVIEIDQQGQMLVRDNGDGTYSGLTVDFMYSPAPILADFKSTPYKNKFMISYSPVEYVNYGLILAGAVPLLASMGLIDAVLTASATTQTTTNIFFGVETECAKTDLVALLGAALGTHVNNFVVVNKATGVAVVPSAAAIIGGEIRLTGTYVSGQTYTVSGSTPAAWLANLVDGYDAEDSDLDIVIP